MIEYARVYFDTPGYVVELYIQVWYTRLRCYAGAGAGAGAHTYKEGVKEGGRSNFT